MIKGRCRLAYNMTYDFIASALAMAARCFCPPYKLLGYRSISWASPTFSRRASGIFFAFSGSSFFTTICASVTFSSSVLCGNKLKDWNTMPTFFRKLCALFKNRFLIMIRDTQLYAIYCNFPSSRISKQFKQRNNVDLPQPDCPIIDTKSPLSISNDMLLRTLLSP